MNIEDLVAPFLLTAVDLYLKYFSELLTQQHTYITQLAKYFTKYQLYIPVGFFAFLAYLVLIWMEIYIIFVLGL